MSEIESCSSGGGSSSFFEESALTNVPIKRKRQAGIESFVVQTSASEKQKLDIKIAKFFYGCNIAFNIADNKLFKDMICALRPGYDPPSRKKVSGELLDTVYKEIEETLKSELSAEDVSFTMMQDGWSSIKNDPIIATSIHTGERSILIDAVEY
uniref:Uncharacterized protein LOC114347821 n=1 Tax=Diabrotica virgifera virgifera TaxID=50390 RepID=A0A6P7H6W0_DIAVI